MNINYIEVDINPYKETSWFNYLINYFKNSEIISNKGKDTRMIIRNVEYLILNVTNNT